MFTRLIAELGSCHMGKIERIKEAIDRCKAVGIDALKLQLFPNKEPYVPTNIWLPPDMFQEAFEYGKSVGLPVSASVFDEESLTFLQKLKPEFIKISYSQKHNGGSHNGEICWAESIYLNGIEPIVSCDIMTEHLVSATATKLYCIPEYPVRYEVCFDGIFEGNYVDSGIPTKTAFPNMPDEGNLLTYRFQGFSDHTLGIRQTRRAIQSGAQVIEKHVRLGYNDETCPDAFFAVKIEELGQLKTCRNPD